MLGLIRRDGVELDQWAVLGGQLKVIRVIKAIENME